MALPELFSAPSRGRSSHWATCCERAGVNGKRDKSDSKEGQVGLVLGLFP